MRWTTQNADTWRKTWAPNQLYRSHFRTPWLGLILKFGPHDTGLVLKVQDKSGRMQRRRFVQWYHLSWLEPEGFIDLSTVNPDWLKIGD